MGKTRPKPAMIATTRGDFRYRDLEQQQTARNHQLLGCCDEPAGKPPEAAGAAPPSGEQSRSGAGI